MEMKPANRNPMACAMRGFVESNACTYAVVRTACLWGQERARRYARTKTCKSCAMAMRHIGAKKEGAARSLLTPRCQQQVCTIRFSLTEPRKDASYV